MATVIRRRSSAYWTAFFRDETGRLHCRSTKETDENKARQIAVQYEQASRTRRTVNQVVRVIEDVQKLIYGDDEEKPMAFLTKKRGASGAESPKLLAESQWDLAKVEAKLFRYAPDCTWHIKLQDGGCRLTFDTKKLDRKAAAVVAKEIRDHLKENGMATTRKVYAEYIHIRTRTKNRAWTGTWKGGRRLPRDLPTWIEQVALRQSESTVLPLEVLPLENGQAKELSTFVIGYILAALESVAASQQISANVRAKVQADLEYARPIIAKIWQLDAIRTEYKQKMEQTAR